MPQRKSTSVREAAVRLRVVLVAPPAGVAFGIQSGSGNGYSTVLRQQSSGGDLAFEFTMTAKDNRPDGLPNFVGPLAQGPVTARFVYVGVGTAAGQSDSPWTRRIKVPLAGIGWDLIDSASGDPESTIVASFAGTAKDGGPACATVKPLDGWHTARG